MTSSSPASGLALRLLAALLVTAMSAVVHGLSAQVPIGQILFWRSAAALGPILLWAAWRGDVMGAVRTARPVAHLSRSALGVVSMALSFISLAYLPVATAQALAFLAPVLSLPLAALWLREPVTRGLGLLVAIGFGGVVAMLWSAFEAPGPGALIGTLAGLGYALTMAVVRVHMKTMTATERPVTIAFWFAIAGSAAGLATLPFGWTATDAATLAWLVLSGVLGGAGHVLAAESLRRAPVSWLAPADFTGLVWALGFDVLLFGAAPGPLALIGALAIGAATLATARPR